MTSSLKSASDNAKKELAGISWDVIPLEIFFYIFEKLDIVSLRCCLLVCRKWKEIVMSLCEMRDLWQKLAEDGIVNHGVTHQYKSILSWKDLYWNSLLWNHLQSSCIKKNEEIDKLDIKYLHVYRDKLIVVSPNSVEYYDVKTFQRIRSFTVVCEDMQETDDMLILVKNNHNNYKATVFLKLDKNELKDVANISMAVSLERDGSHFSLESRRWRTVDNRVYVLDSRSILWECRALNEKLAVRSLARFYGDFHFSTVNSMNSIHVVKENVYVVLEGGDIVLVVKNSMMFRKVREDEVPTVIIKGPNINKYPPYRKGSDKFDVIIKLPFDVCCEGVIAPHYLLHFHYIDPDMTCALQHGDVVFRGFKDGTVDITLLRDNSKLQINVMELDTDVIEDPAVTGLEVCELKNIHRLFIATATKLYTTTLTYPDSLLEN